MIYLGEKDIKKIGIDWRLCTDVIRDVVFAHHRHDVVQPIKPYLRYKSLKNRIIAMPAYVGGTTDTAGIKWIASFPENIKKGLPRASCAVILNDSATGQIISIIYTGLISTIRTASVSSLMIRLFLEARELKNMRVGIIGLGPIGLHHLKMCSELYGDKISEFAVFDLDEKRAEAAKEVVAKVTVCKTWQDAYRNSDIVLTCTVSNGTYIDERPKDGSLLLNISLRDYTSKVFDFVKNSIIVDDWEEVCRENTDIEVFHKMNGLTKEQTRSIDDVVVNNCLATYPPNVPIMFNPMGMAMFDIAIGKFYLDLAQKRGIGINLK